uniref:Synaptogyrin 2b n=1 Tax=Sinocyclocheilus rhinocerous TaxID=307959 RepID=A0A673K7W3_9TELE
MESNSAAYGASLDLIKFIKQPQTIIRFLSWVFAIVVFASITAEGYVNSSTENQVKCVFNRNEGACHYGVGIGVIAFLACIAFLLADAFLPSMSNAQERKYVVMADLGFSGAWTFLWFVCFCLMADQWSKTQDTSGIPTRRRPRRHRLLILLHRIVGSVKLLRSGEVSSGCCRCVPELRRSAGGPHVTVSHHLHAANVSVLPEHRSRRLPAAVLKQKLKHDNQVT